jgi:hypothetical protein
MRVPEQSGHAMPVCTSTPSPGRSPGIEKSMTPATARRVPIAKISRWYTFQALLRRLAGRATEA